MFDLAGYVDAVQQHIGGAQQMGQLFFLDAVDQVFNGVLVFGAGLGTELMAEMVDGGGQEAAGATCRVHHAFAFIQTWINAIGHEGGDGARGVKLTGIACTAQVVEHLFVNIA